VNGNGDTGNNGGLDDSRRPSGLRDDVDASTATDIANEQGLLFTGDDIHVALDDVGFRVARSPHVDGQR